MSNRGLAARPVWIDQKAENRPRVAEEPATVPEVPRTPASPAEDHQGVGTGGADTAPVLQEVGARVVLEDYPVGRWYQTTTRRAGKVLYQQITVTDAGLTVEDQLWTGRVAAGDTSAPLPAIGIRRTYAGKRMTIGHMHHRRRQVEKRQDCEIQVLEFLEANTFTDAEDLIATRTHIIQAVYDVTEWAKADLDQALVAFVERGLARWRGERLEVNDKGRVWLADEKERRRLKRIFARPLGLTGEDRHDLQMENEDMTGATP